MPRKMVPTAVLPDGTRSYKYPQAIVDYIAENPDVSYAEIRAKGDELGFPIHNSSIHWIRLKCGIENRPAGYGRHEWTDEENQWLVDNAPGVRWVDLGDMFNARWGTDMDWKRIKRHGTLIGARNGFKGSEGLEPYNKGKPVEEWLKPEQIERMRETQFKKGNLPHNAKPGIGHERVSKDGFVEVKVREHSEPGKPNTYELKQRVMFERYHGRPPGDDCVVAFANRDRRDFSEENLVEIPRSVWQAITTKNVGYHDRDTLECAIAYAKLRHEVRRVNLTKRCWNCGKEFVANGESVKTCPDCLALGVRAPRTRKAKGYMKSNYITRWLLESGHTQKWLAEKTGLSYSTITAYCSGERQPRITSIRLLAAVMGVDYTELADGMHWGYDQWNGGN